MHANIKNKRRTNRKHTVLTHTITSSYLQNKLSPILLQMFPNDEYRWWIWSSPDFSSSTTISLTFMVQRVTAGFWCRKWCFSWTLIIPWLDFSCHYPIKISFYPNWVHSSLVWSQLLLSPCWRILLGQLLLMDRLLPCMAAPLPSVCEWVNERPTAKRFVP